MDHTDHRSAANDETLQRLLQYKRVGRHQQSQSDQIHSHFCAIPRTGVHPPDEAHERLPPAVLMLQDQFTASNPLSFILCDAHKHARQTATMSCHIRATPAETAQQTRCDTCAHCAQLQRPQPSVVDPPPPHTLSSFAHKPQTHACTHLHTPLPKPAGVSRLAHAQTQRE